MLQVRDVMTREVFSVTPETTIREAADLLTHHHVSGAPVLAGHRVVGVVSATDLLDFMASHETERCTSDGSDDPADDDEAPDDGENEASALYFTNREPDEATIDDGAFPAEATRRSDAFDEHTIEEVMTRSVRWLPPDASVRRAAAYMWHAGIHRLLILEGGRLRGILSMSDVARVLAIES